MAPPLSTPFNSPIPSRPPLGLARPLELKPLPPAPPPPPLPLVVSDIDGEVICCIFFFSYEDTDDDNDDDGDDGDDGDGATRIEEEDDRSDGT